MQDRMEDFVMPMMNKLIYYSYTYYLTEGIGKDVTAEEINMQIIMIQNYSNFLIIMWDIQEKMIIQNYQIFEQLIIMNKRK